MDVLRQVLLSIAENVAKHIVCRNGWSPDDKCFVVELEAAERQLVDLCGRRIELDGDERDFLVWRWASGRSVEILDIAVGSERGVGKGTRLINLLLDEVRDKTSMVYAITRAHNTIARQFYSALGFRQLAKMYRFYEEEDACMYGRDL